MDSGMIALDVMGNNETLSGEVPMWKIASEYGTHLNSVLFTEAHTVISRPSQGDLLISQHAEQSAVVFCATAKPAILHVRTSSNPICVPRLLFMWSMLHDAQMYAQFFRINVSNTCSIRLLNNTWSMLNKRLLSRDSLQASLTWQFSDRVERTQRKVPSRQAWRGILSPGLTRRHVQMTVSCIEALNNVNILTMPPTGSPADTTRSYITAFLSSFCITSIFCTLTRRTTSQSKVKKYTVDPAW